MTPDTMPHQSQREWHIWFDGSACPNPGRIGLGVFVLGPEGQQREYSGLAAQGGCNNEAELLALASIPTDGRIVVVQQALRKGVDCDLSGRADINRDPVGQSRHCRPAILPPPSADSLGRRGRGALGTDRD